jgi:hypothetical protein
VECILLWGSEEQEEGIRMDAAQDRM